jgi:hypothetical protein
MPARYGPGVSPAFVCELLDGQDVDRAWVLLSMGVGVVDEHDGLGAWNVDDPLVGPASVRHEVWVWPALQEWAHRREVEEQIDHKPPSPVVGALAIHPLPEWLDAAERHCCYAERRRLSSDDPVS